MKLKMMWVNFEAPPPYSWMQQGCGVTAFSQEDALAILREKVFMDGQVPAIRSLVESIDLESLDQNHVRRNMGNPVLRGVWFPLGFT